MKRTIIGLALVALAATLVSAEQRTLDFDSRVSCQRDIERAYHAHRVGATLGFDEAVPQELLVEKVETYLKQSLALQQFWNAPISARLLQRELERVAAHTQSPGRLLELFLVLENDAFLVQECLVRPILADRLARSHLAAETGDPEDWESWWAGVERGLDPLLVAAVAAEITLPQPITLTTPPDPSTTPLLLGGAPAARNRHTAIWTGSEMIVWGGGAPGTTDTGGRYDPATSLWTATSTANAPSARQSHTAVWTGERMIVWGGRFQQLLLGTGASYDPGSDSWETISDLNAPDPRFSHTAVWTGSEMIVWGGAMDWPDAFPVKTGGRYDPVTDNWSQTRRGGAPRPRFAHTSVWTGSEMIAWGGEFKGKVFNDGRRYDPIADRWRRVAKSGAPDGRFFHSATWTGSEMIVWGGSDTDVGLASGARFDPTSNSWSPTSMLGAPEGRVLHTAVWTGSALLVWAGNRPGSGALNTGGRYDPLTDTWTPTSLVNVPRVRSLHTAVWTELQMIVWGGSTGTLEYGDGGRYDPAPADAWTLF